MEAELPRVRIWIQRAERHARRVAARPPVGSARPEIEDVIDFVHARHDLGIEGGAVCIPIDHQVAIPCEDALLHLCGRNRSVGATGLAGVRALVVREEERLVPRDRAAEGQPILVAVLGPSLNAGCIVEKVVGVELVIAKEVPAGSVKLVRSRLDLRVDDRSLAPAELGVVRPGLDLEGLERVRGRLNGLGAPLLPVGRERVVVDAVEGEVVLEREIAVDVDSRLSGIRPRPRCGDRAGTEQNQVGVPPPVERKVLDLGGFDHGA